MPQDREKPATDNLTPDPGPDLPPANDPGGAHAKGYGADPDPNAPPLPDPIPLAEEPDTPIHIPNERPAGGGR